MATMPQAQLVTDCPRCGAREMTFDAISAVPVGINHGWQKYFEVYSVCRKCTKGSIFNIKQTNYDDTHAIDRVGPIGVGALNRFFTVNGYVSAKDRLSSEIPEHLPDIINNAFREGAMCLAVQCYNAAGAMFRLSVDLTSKDVVARKGLAPTGRAKDYLFDRLKWLFENHHLPDDLETLSHAIRNDGNDGVHEGTLNKEDAEDLLDFTQQLLDRIYTRPKKVELAMERTKERRKKDSTDS